MDRLADKPTDNPRKAEALSREIMACAARVYRKPTPQPDAAPATESDTGSAGSGSGSN
jgi:hypothetical protein